MTIRIMRGKWFLAAVPVALAVGCGSSSGSGTVAAPSLSYSPAPVVTVTIPPDTSSPVPAATDVPTLTQPPVVPTVSAATAWAKGGGLTHIQALTIAFGEVHSGGAAGDASATRQGCIDLTVAVAGALTYQPIPLAAAQQDWAAALTDLNSAATDCAAGLDSGDNALVAKSGNELNAGGDELSAANKILLAAP